MTRLTRDEVDELLIAAVHAGDADDAAMEAAKTAKTAYHRARAAFLKADAEYKKQLVADAKLDFLPSPAPKTLQAEHDRNLAANKIAKAEADNAFN